MTAFASGSANRWNAAIVSPKAFMLVMLSSGYIAVRRARHTLYGADMDATFKIRGLWTPAAIQTLLISRANMRGSR
ncbi:hypothetical protein AX768_21835 [Burkholderia sp. PAMC 28687]|nr:hypothetical protein AX768_21835 [Burkholderia sp. PAMC 28687]